MKKSDTSHVTFNCYDLSYIKELEILYNVNILL